MRDRAIAACIGAISAFTLCVVATRAGSQTGTAETFSDTFIPTRDHHAIQYSARTPADAISRLNRRISDGQVRLTFEPDSGYLRSVLAALDVPIASQVAVFSKTSLQATRITPGNPRVVFFNDAVAVAWPRGGFIEAAAVDPEQGAVFYTMQQSSMTIPGFIRNDTCLRCHIASATLGVPGLAVASVIPEPDGQVSTAPSNISDHRLPFDRRWGGWYVTGKRVPMRHMGNLVAEDPDHPALKVTDDSIRLESLKTMFDTRGYPSTYSDVVALMVLDHQAHMINLLTRFGWDVRVAMAGAPLLSAVASLAPVSPVFEDALRDGAREIVDYLLFVDEAPLTAAVEGASGFAEQFAAAGPRDRRGRSLRDLDLHHRLLRYPCSYLIYSDQFARLPAQAREAIYRRMWDVLSKGAAEPRYARLAADDRQVIVEILRDTKKDLPAYWK